MKEFTTPFSAYTDHEGFGRIRDHKGDLLAKDLDPLDAAEIARAVNSHEAAQRLAEAAKYIEYAMPEDDPENEEVVTIHLTPKGLRDFRAALAEWEAAK